MTMLWFNSTGSCHLRDSEFRNPEKLCSWNPKSWALESRIHWQRLEYSTFNPVFTALNPESKTVLDYLTWGEMQSAPGEMVMSDSDWRYQRITKSSTSRSSPILSLFPLFPFPAVTVIWASPRFGHPHPHIPSVLGIPGGGCPKRSSLRLCLNYFRLGNSRDCQSRIYGWIV